MLAVACTKPLPSPVADGSSVAASAPARAQALPLADWRDDARVTAHLRPTDAREALEDRPPNAIEAVRIVDDPDVCIEAVQSIWTDAEGSGDAGTWIHRAYVLVRRADRVHVVELARQYREPVYGSSGPPDPPRVEAVHWNGAGAQGPDLVLTVATQSVWGTQCRDGRDARTDVIVCELDPGSMRCGRAPVELDFFDGCAGAENVDRPPDAEEEPCGRVGFSATWAARPDELRVTLDAEDDVDCLGDGSPFYLEPLPPATTTSYATLLAAPHALRVIDIDP
jgi:hypothetical protein